MKNKEINHLITGEYLHGIPNNKIGEPCCLILDKTTLHFLMKNQDNTMCDYPMELNHFKKITVRSTNRIKTNEKASTQFDLSELLKPHGLIGLDLFYILKENNVQKNRIDMPTNLQFSYEIKIELEEEPYSSFILFEVFSNPKIFVNQIESMIEKK